MPLLERDSEFAAVDDLIAAGGRLIIEGGAGSGKSSLINETCLRAERHGREVLRAHGSELETRFAFGVVRQLFERRLLAADDGEREVICAGPAAAAWPVVSGQRETASTRDKSFAVLHGLYWLAANLAARSPVLIAVDDAHWADSPSIRWLAYLAPRLEGPSISLVIALRRAQPAWETAAFRAVRAGATVVRPQVLSQSAVTAIVRAGLGPAARDEFCAAVRHVSGGNPFYVHELLRGIEADAHPVQELKPGDLHAHVGDSIASQVAARIQPVDRRAMRFAQALAVLGDGCELRQAAALAGVDMDDALRLAAALIRAEVLSSDDPAHFLHPIVHGAVEASLQPDELDTKHRAAARLLFAEGAPAGKVASHIVRLRPAGDEWVLARLREAARDAVDGGAPAEGAELYERALLEPPRQAERVKLLREAGDAQSLAGHEAACDLFEEAIQLSDNPRERAEIGFQLAMAHDRMFRWASAADAGRRALDELDDRDPALAARIESVVVAGSLRDATRAWMLAPSLRSLSKRHLEGAPAHVEAAAKGMVALWFDGRPADEVVELLERAFERVDDWNEVVSLTAPALFALVMAEGFGAAKRALESLRDAVERSGFVRGLCTAYGALGFLWLRLGSLPDAEASARIGLRIVRDAEFAQGLPLVASVLADIQVEAGELNEAQTLLSRISMDELPNAQLTMTVISTLGRLRLAQGRAEEALAEFERCRAMYGAAGWGTTLHDNGSFHARSGAARALLRLGDEWRARELAEAELADARAFKGSRALGVALRQAGLTTGGQSGLDLLEESVSVLQESPAQLERAYSLVEFGAALRRSGRRSAAQEPLAEGLDIAAHAGARPLVARSREELRATGARPRSEWRTGVRALTPSELRVARMAADGRTNREIAQELYITQKTVEGHLARAYSKLDIDGRAGLAQGLTGEKTRVTTH